MLQAGLLLNALCRADVRFVVIGGRAAVLHGSAYVTADLDICYQREAVNLQRLADVLGPFRPRLRGAPIDLPFRLDAATLKSGLNFTLTTDAGDLDLLGEVAGLGGYDAVQASAEPIELGEDRVWILTLDGLIVSKRAAGRPKDARLVDELEVLKALRAPADDEAS